MPSYSKRVLVPGRSSQEIYDRLSQELERFLEKATAGKVDVERDPNSRTLRFKHSMVSGSVVCSDGALALDAQLSLFAAPFRSKIDEGIDRWIAKTFETAKT